MHALTFLFPNCFLSCDIFCILILKGIFVYVRWSAKTGAKPRKSSINKYIIPKLCLLNWVQRVLQSSLITGHMGNICIQYMQHLSLRSVKLVSHDALKNTSHVCWSRKSSTGLTKAQAAKLMFLGQQLLLHTLFYPWQFWLILRHCQCFSPSILITFMLGFPHACLHVTCLHCVHIRWYRAAVTKHATVHITCNYQAA